MWEKIKNWFKKALDLNLDNKVTVEDLEIAQTIANEKVKKANEVINEAVGVAKTVKKATKGRKKKK